MSVISPGKWWATFRTTTGGETMDKDEIAALRAAAEAATKGAWYARDDMFGVWSVGSEQNGDSVPVTGDDVDEHDARFIAAASPGVVLSLLDTISALTERAERAETQLAKLDQAWIDLQADIIEAAAIPFGHGTVAYVRGLRERAERAERERDRLCEAMPTDEERAAVVQVFDEAWFQDRDKIRPWLARLDAVQNGGE